MFLHVRNSISSAYSRAEARFVSFDLPAFLFFCLCLCEGVHLRGVPTWAKSEC